MDYIEHFRRDARAFVAAVRAVAGADPEPVIPSCPGWTVTDLVLHLGYVHRAVAYVLSERLTQAPQPGDLSWLALPAEHEGWMRERVAQLAGGGAVGALPARRPLPAALVQWCSDGAAALDAQFRATPASEPVWTWAADDQTAEFWQRMQAIEAAVHRWDAQNATGRPSPVDPGLAADSILQTFQVMAPMRRAMRHAPPDLLDIHGDAQLADRYFDLVPPL